MSNNSIPTITVAELKKLQQKQSVFILDVREPHEYEEANMGGHLIPLGELVERLNEIDTSMPVVVHCRSGGRSARAVKMLQEANIPAKNLEGGITAWLAAEK